MNNNKFIKLISYLVSIIIIFCAGLIFFWVSIPLFDINVTEVDKKKVIGMKISVPLEFNGESQFWWLIRPDNTLNFANSSDEKINGTIILELEDNPCKIEELLKVTSNSTTQNIVTIPNAIAIISFPLEIKPKSSQVIEIVFQNKKGCFVKNGDARDFGARLKNWKYE